MLSCRRTFKFNKHLRAMRTGTMSSTWTYPTIFQESNDYLDDLKILKSKKMEMKPTHKSWESNYIINSVQFSHSVMSDSLWLNGLQHTRLPCPSPTPKVYSNSCSLSMWCHPTISSSGRPLLLPPSIFPSLRVFSNESVFRIRRPSIGVSASASVLPMNIQDWFPLGWTGWNSLQSKGLSRVFSNTTVQKHQFFSTQLSLWSNSHIHTWLLEKS